MMVHRMLRNLHATLNKNSGAASAIFIKQAPPGTEILISYDHNSDGVMGALSRGFIRANMARDYGWRGNIKSRGNAW